MGEAIDRKFKFTAVSLNSGKKYTQNNAVVFLAKDALLPALLDKYEQLCIDSNVGSLQIDGVRLLKDRVLYYQRMNQKLVKHPDVGSGKEEKRICKSNKNKL
jgi:hypothetical protein